MISIVQGDPKSNTLLPGRNGTCFMKTEDSIFKYKREGGGFETPYRAKLFFPQKVSEVLFVVYPVTPA